MVATTGRVALVTGAASGIGPAYAQRLAEDGYEIAAVDLVDSSDTVSIIKGLGREAESYICDVASPSAVAEMSQAMLDRFGRCDVLVNNVGISPYNAFMDIPYEEWREVMRVNLDSLFLMCQAFLPVMKSRGWGRIINITTSACWMYEVPNMSHYVTSKMAVVGFTRALATEVGVDGVTVNAISPSLVRTPLLMQRLSAEWFQEMVDTQSVKRTQEPSDLVGALSFLASDDSGFVTGQTLAVNGGNARL